MAKPTNKNTAMTKWDEELAKQAEIAAGMEAGTGTGQFFSLQSGVLSFAGAPIPENKMAVVILDGILENVYYAGKYNPDSPTGPSCFAFGRSEADMVPHEVAVEAGTSQGGEGNSCATCPMNEWGTAETGRGKACRNTRRLAMVMAGDFDAQGRFQMITDPEHFASAGIAYMRLPVTSIKGYAAFVKQLAATTKRPPHGIVTKITLVPDVQTQFKVVFAALDSIPNDLMSVIMDRHKEAEELIAFPYQPFEEQAAAPAPAPRRAAPAPRPAPAPARRAAPAPARAVAGPPRRPAPAPAARPLAAAKGRKKY